MSASTCTKLAAPVDCGCPCIQDLELPESLKGLYKTVWEIKQRALVDMAADRGAYIDQSQSFNVHMSDPNFGKLTSLHFYGWKVHFAHGLNLYQPLL